MNHRHLFFVRGLLALVTTGSLLAWPAQACPHQADTPAHLLDTIRHLAAQGEYAALEAYIHPLILTTPGEAPLNVRQALIEGIRGSRPNQTFGYSDLALSLLLNQYINEFRPLEASQVNRFTEEVLSGDAGLKALVKKTPEAFLVFDRQVSQICGPGSLVVLVKQNGTYKLLFWEELHCIRKD